MRDLLDDPVLFFLSLLLVAGITFLVCAILDYYGYLFPLLEYIFIRE